MSKARSLTMPLLFCLGLLFSPQPGYGKTAGVGTTLTKDIHVGDSLAGEMGQLQLAIYVAYYFGPAVSVSAAFETDVESSPVDPIDRGMSFGGDYTFLPLFVVSPFCKGEALFLFSPDLSLGYRLGAGLRLDLFPLLGTDNIYLNYQASLRSVFFKENGPFHSIEFFRIGVEVAF